MYSSVYSPYSNNHLMQSVPLDDQGTFAHPPFIMDGEFSEVWTNPNLYGFASLLNTQRNSRAYVKWMEDHKLPALFLGPHHEDTFWFEHRTGVKANCLLDYDQIHIEGSVHDFLDRLTSSRRRSLRKVMEDNFEVRDVGSVANFNLHNDVSAHLYTLTAYHEGKVPEKVKRFLEQRIQTGPLHRIDAKDLTWGMFNSMYDKLRLKQQEDNPLGHILRSVKLLVITDLASGFVISVHLVSENLPAKEYRESTPNVYMHSFARVSVLHARPALLLLIKAVQGMRYLSSNGPHFTHVDVTNVALSEREQYKSDFFTDSIKVTAWASTALLEQKLPFVTPL